MMKRKRARVEPPAASSELTLSVADIMGPLAALNDSYALEQFNDSWTREAQSPTAYTQADSRNKEASSVNAENQRKAATDPRESSSNKNNPLQIIMDSFGKELFDSIGSDDMDIEDDDAPPPPPPANTSPSTTPLHPPPVTKVTKVTKAEVKEKEKSTTSVRYEIASIVKLALKVPYKKKKITKEEYKNILKQVVSKVYDSRQVKRGDPLRPDKITEMVAVYIKQSKHQKAKQQKAKKEKDAVTKETE